MTAGLCVCLIGKPLSYRRFNKRIRNEEVIRSTTLSLVAME